MIIGAFLVITAVAGQEIPEIKVIHRVRNDSVILRWAPNTAVAWQIGNRYGYRITRYQINGQGDSLITESVVLADNIKPWPLDDWEEIVRNNSYAAIAAQALYGESFEITDPANNPTGFYNQVTEQENRFGFSLYAADMSLPVAVAMGLSYADMDIDNGKRYAYRVALQNNPSDYKVQDGIVVVNPAEPLVLPEPADPAINFSDGQVKISWDSFFDQGIYIAYSIERSEDGGKSFKKRSEVPFTVMNKHRGIQRRIYFLDSLEQNYKLYTYRIRGITSFGETGPPSKMLAGTGTGSARGLTASIDTVFLQQDGGAYLQWRFPEEVKKNLLGYIVSNATKAKGPFHDISGLLAPDQMSFVDGNPMPVNYYTIKVVSRDSVTTTSLPALLQPPDSTGPSMPQNLQAKVDTFGYVYLNWAPSPESDVAGYRVFRANSPDEEFMQITASAVKFSEYRDSITLNTLTEDIYYKVAAVDHRDNFSAFSGLLKVEKPDMVPPAPPVFQSYTSGNEGIHLKWTNSISVDVVEHRLIRTDREKKSKVITLQPGQEVYHDNEIVPGEVYIYTLKAWDDSGLFSTAADIHVQAFSSGYKPAVRKIRAQADKTAQLITLTWDYQLQGISRFLIYRQKNNEPMRLYRDADAKTRTFVDNGLSVNNVYHYQVKALFTNDDESELSEVVKVVY